MRRGSDNLALTRGGPVLPAWWWWPQGEVCGLMWLQHGFTRRPWHLAGLAAWLAEAAGVAVVAPAVSSRFVGRGGWWINGAAMHETVAHLFGDQGRDALAASAVAALGPGVALPDAFVLAGHSAGGNLAASAAAWTTEIERGGGLAVDDLRGVLLLDGVQRHGRIVHAATHLAGAHERPLWTIAAPDARCNAHGVTTRRLRAARPDRFVGVVLEQGTHVDAEGPDSDRRARLVCGTPGAAEVAALRTLAADWLRHLFAGTPGAARLADTRPGTVTDVDGAAVRTL